jgi:hypothetical protein
MNNVAETIYRLTEYIQMTIKLRSNVDSFNVYQSTNIAGPWTFLLNVENTQSEKRFKGRTVFQFNPNLIGWSNDVSNYIVIHPVVGGVEGAQEGPVTIFPLHYEHAKSVDRTSIFVYDKGSERYVPATTDMTAFK